jgi:hypothetical protein
MTHSASELLSDVILQPPVEDKGYFTGGAPVDARFPGTQGNESQMDDETDVVE